MPTVDVSFYTPPMPNKTPPHPSQLPAAPVTKHVSAHIEVDVAEAPAQVDPIALAATAPLRVPRALRMVFAARIARLQACGFRSVWVRTAVGRVHVLERGVTRPNAATWVFLHGYASESSGWGGVLRRLRRRCSRIVALDFPGHGRSDAPSAGITPESLIRGAEQAMEQRLQQGERLVLVANSMGGIGAIRLAKKYRNQVLGLVLISPAGAPMTPTDIQEVIAKFTLNSAERALAFVDMLFPAGIACRPLVAKVLRQYLMQDPILKLLHALPEFRPIQPSDLHDMPPTLLLWGGSDTILPSSGKQFYATNLPASTTTVLSPTSFGHAPFLDQPGPLTRHLQEWAARYPGMLV